MNPQDNGSPVIQATQFFKEGRLEEARRISEELLEKTPDNADAHTLCFAIAMRQQNIARAQDHAEKTVALRPENPIARINLSVVLMQTGKLEEALEHLDAAVAASPEDYFARFNRGKLYTALFRFEDAITDLKAAVNLSPNQADARTALADALTETGQFDAAAAEIQAAVRAGGGSEIERTYVWGRLMFRAGRFEDAHQAFAAALSANPNEMKHYTALAAASFHSGAVRQAEAVTRGCFRRFPSKERSAGDPELRVLVLEGLEFGHFRELSRRPFNYARGNFIAHMLPGRVAYTHVVTDCLDSLAEAVDLDGFDLAINNRAIPELIDMRGQAEHFEKLVADLPMPLLNRPRGIAQTGRGANAERLASAENFIFPKTIRVEHDVDIAATRAAILDALKLPIILRPLHTHIGVGAIRVEDEAGLGGALAKHPFSELYAIEYHDCVSEDGLYRRYRSASIDGRYFGCGMHAASQWNVHADERLKINWYERGLDREEMAFDREPESVLGATPEDFFAEITESTDLDIFGIDYAHRRDGRVVIFEINAAMALSLDAELDDFPYWKPSLDRIALAIEELFFERAGKTPAGS